MNERVRFLDKTHQYFLGERELISVSAFTKMFEPKKDWKAIATKYAKKNGESAEYWQEKWREKARYSAGVGTILHNDREEALMAQEKFEFFGVECDKLQCEVIDGIKYSLPITNLQMNVVYPELMIYDLEYGVSGQSDKVIVTDTHIHVLDYKTDKEIKFKGYSSQWKKSDKFLAPIQHLDDCNGNAYSLKMSMYMYFLWRQNKHLKPGKLIIQHITLKRDDEDLPILIDGKPVILKEENIEIPYRKMEVIDMLKYWKSTQLEELEKI